MAAAWRANILALVRADSFGRDAKAAAVAATTEGGAGLYIMGGLLALLFNIELLPLLEDEFGAGEE